MNERGVPKHFTVCNSSRSLKQYLNAKSRKELIEEGCKQLGLNPGEGTSLVWEEDGTEVHNEDYFSSLETDTVLMILNKGEEWQEQCSSESDNSSTGRDLEELLADLNETELCVAGFKNQELDKIVSCDPSVLASHLRSESDKDAKRIQGLCEKKLFDSLQKNELLGLFGLNERSKNKVRPGISENKTDKMEDVKTIEDIGEMKSGTKIRIDADSTQLKSEGEPPRKQIKVFELYQKSIKKERSNLPEQISQAARISKTDKASSAGTTNVQDTATSTLTSAVASSVAASPAQSESAQAIEKAAPKDAKLMRTFTVDEIITGLVVLEGDMVLVSVYSSSNYKLKLFDLKGNKLKEHSQKEYCRISKGEDNNVFVLYPDSNCLELLHVANNTIKVKATTRLNGKNRYWAITACGNNAVAVSYYKYGDDSYHVDVVDWHGKVLKTFDTEGLVWSMCTLPGGDLMCGDNDWYISRLNIETGTVLFHTKIPQIPYPSGVASLTSRAILVCDGTDNTLSLLDEGGTFIRQFDKILSGGGIYRVSVQNECCVCGQLIGGKIYVLKLVY